MSKNIRAFPKGFPNQFEDDRGMTLRDYFASCMISSGHTFGPKRSLDPDEVAKQSYQLADAMLKAREQ